MAYTPAQIDALPDYTAAQMAKLWRNVIAELGSNPEASTVGPNNHAYTWRNLDEAQRMLKFWQEQAALEADTTADLGCPVVTMQEAQS